MQKSRFRKPFNSKGERIITGIKEKAGVYIIKNSKQQIVYVGYSGYDLFKTMYRHFYSWKDETQKRATFDKRRAYTVRIVITTPKKAYDLEKALIQKYKPTKNHYKYKGFFVTPKEEKVKEEYFATEVTSLPDLEW